MRISDWSSDVCSSDLADLVRAAGFPTTKGDVLQPATLWFQLGGVDTDALAHLFRDAVDGMLPVSEVIRTRLLDLNEQDEIPIFRSEEHTSELQSLMRISYAVFCLKKKHTCDTEYKLRRET